MPKVSIGIPVYNAQNYLSQTLESLLNQTFTDIEFIISDNGSTDDTEQICLNAAARDSRVRYYRSDINNGASWNFNRVVMLSEGIYFKWASHDDLCAPDFLKKCVEILDNEPDTILCYSNTVEIDDKNNPIKDVIVNPLLGSESPSIRFKTCWRYPPQVPVFGLMRIEKLRQTGLIGNFCSADKVLICQLSLLGPFHGITEPLFYYRRHDQQSTASPHPTHTSRVGWYAPEKKGKRTFPHWRILGEHIIMVTKYKLRLSERVECYLNLLYWIRISWRKLVGNLLRTDRFEWGYKRR